MVIHNKLYKSCLNAQKKRTQRLFELGRLDGLKGGKIRAQKLSAKRRSEIARKAALARWGKAMREILPFLHLALKYLERTRDILDKNDRFRYN